jgi:ribosomal-protein-alanine N-acetyltransferase
VSRGDRPAAAAAGEPVRLRPIRPEDYPLLFDWYNDAELIAPFDRFSVDTWESFVTSIESAAEDPASLAARFAVERVADGKMLGFVGYYAAHPVLTLVDVWYVLGDRAERGKGYGLSAVRQLVAHVFATQPVERVGATCDVENVPSARLLERIGLEREGLLHQALFHHGRWHDVLVYGVTRARWAPTPG